MTLRTVRAVPGQIGDAVARAKELTELMNERHGTDYAIAMQVGGDPDVLAASAVWASLGDYQRAREAYMADEDIIGPLHQASVLFSSTEDQIARVLAVPGERDAFTATNQGRMHTARMAEAIPFGLEVAEFVEAKVGLKVGFATAVTGNRSDVAWFARYASLDQLQTMTETLEADPEYLDFFKRSEDLFVDASLVQTIWQRV